MPISTFKLAAGLAQKECWDVFAILPQEGELGSKLKARSVKLTIIPFHRFKTNPISFLHFVFTYFLAGIRLYKFIRKNKIDIVHFSDLIDAPFYPWARISGAKVAAHVRVCIGRPFTRFMFKTWAFLFCSHIITISQFVKSYYGFHKRTSVVYNPGPDRELFSADRYPRRTLNGVDDGTDNIPLVFTAASFRREKGHHNFLKIASLIKERFGADVRFVIVGGKVQGHEEYYDEMMEEIKHLNLNSCLTVTGNIPHEKVPAIMAGASVFMFAPEWEEALGGVILEAMAMNAAVVAYDCGGISECFTDGESGYLIKRGDFDAAADKIVTLLKSPSLIKNITDEARAELDRKFTLDSYLDGVENIYEKLLEAR